MQDIVITNVKFATSSDPGGVCCDVVVCVSSARLKAQEKDYYSAMQKQKE